MSKEFEINDFDKDERIRRHQLKEKSRNKKKMREERISKGLKSKKPNKINWNKDYDLYDEYEEYM